ncbi:hypothetical protein [Escherichia coli]|uniref:hypothetical protein n=1 Tax=Escherichia coli TaxID=562 RepID=UPI0017A07C5E|nr:hypothetical protein [Escherichia coli]EFM6520590.1 hypothetical protein [Escherichia coli]EIV9095340.1 hypothetical protein [Escherichia coli]HCL9682431.1 hypothetical protein [Escherichia coli]
MADFPTMKATRPARCDFVLWEQRSSAGFSRKTIAVTPAADVPAGSLVDDNGAVVTVAKASADVDAAKIKGISLFGFNKTKGMFDDGSVEMCVLYRDAEVKSSILPADADIAKAITAQLEKMRIRVVSL